jgi:hypothetical protein
MTGRRVLPFSSQQAGGYSRDAGDRENHEQADGSDAVIYAVVKELEDLD